MSKYVKNLITEHLRDRFKDVQEALLVNMVGLDANANNRLRAELREKDIHVVVVKNSLARRATEGTPLTAMFEGLTGSSAVCWGSDDMVALAKEITRLARDQQYEAFQPRGGVMDGERLTSRQVAEVSRWPSREELLAIVAGQVIGVASEVASQLVGPATQVASQIEKMIEDRGGDGHEPAAPESGEQPAASESGEQPAAPESGEQPEAPESGEQPEAPES